MEPGGWSIAGTRKRRVSEVPPPSFDCEVRTRRPTEAPAVTPIVVQAYVLCTRTDKYARTAMAGLGVMVVRGQ